MKQRTRLLLIVLLLTVLVLSACGPIVRGPGKKTVYQDVLLLTEDNITIAGSYYPSESTRGVVLLHMMGKNRFSFKDIPEELSTDFKVLTIDLRGHGDSDLEFSKMQDKEFSGMVYDVAAAVKFLEDQGVPQGKVSLLGASIGANAAFLYVQDHPVDRLVLAAPGSSYRSLDISRIIYTKPLLVQVAYYDAYASMNVDTLSPNWDGAKVIVYESSAHGSDLYLYDLSAKEDLLFYLK